MQMSLRFKIQNYFVSSQAWCKIPTSAQTKRRSAFPAFSRAPVGARLFTSASPNPVKLKT